MRKQIIIILLLITNILAAQENTQLMKEVEIKNMLLRPKRDSVKVKLNNIYHNNLLDLMKSIDATKLPIIYKKKITTSAKILVHVDSLVVNLVRVDGNIVNNNLDSMFLLATKYCTIDNIDYYKYKNHIFYNDRIDIQTKTMEKGICGVKKRNNKIRYYRDIPKKVQEWCCKNITANGFYTIEYIYINKEEYLIQTIKVSKEFEKNIQKSPSNANSKKAWKNVGEFVLLEGITSVAVSL